MYDVSNIYRYIKPCYIFDTLFECLVVPTVAIVGYTAMPCCNAGKIPHRTITSTFYRVPILLQDMIKLIKVQLDIKPRGKNKLMRKWHDLADTYDITSEPVIVLNRLRVWFQTLLNFFEV